MTNTVAIKLEAATRHYRTAAGPSTHGYRDAVDDPLPFRFSKGDRQRRSAIHRDLRTGRRHRTNLAPEDGRVAFHFQLVETKVTARQRIPFDLRYLSERNHFPQTRQSRASGRPVFLPQDDDDRRSAAFDLGKACPSNSSELPIVRSRRGADARGKGKRGEDRQPLRFSRSAPGSLQGVAAWYSEGPPEPIPGRRPTRSRRLRQTPRRACGRGGSSPEGPSMSLLAMATHRSQI